jgi:hypothetical protein
MLERERERVENQHLGYLEGELESASDKTFDVIRVKSIFYSIDDRPRHAAQALFFVI